MGDSLGAFDALRCDLGFAGVVAIPLLDRLLVHIPLYHSNSFRTSALSRQFAHVGFTFKSYSTCRKHPFRDRWVVTLVSRVDRQRAHPVAVLTYLHQCVHEPFIPRVPRRASPGSCKCRRVP